MDNSAAIAELTGALRASRPQMTEQHVISIASTMLATAHTLLAENNSAHWTGPDALSNELKMGYLLKLINSTLTFFNVRNFACLATAERLQLGIMNELGSMDSFMLTLEKGPVGNRLKVTPPERYSDYAVELVIEMPRTQMVTVRAKNSSEARDMIVRLIDRETPDSVMEHAGTTFGDQANLRVGAVRPIQSGEFFPIVEYGGD